MTSLPRVCLVSDCLALPADEGARAAAWGLAAGLSRHTDFLPLATHPHASPGETLCWARTAGELRAALEAFGPDLVLSFPHASNTLPALWRAGRLAARVRPHRHAFVAYQPRRCPALLRAAQAWLQPDVVLCFSEKSARRLSAEGVRARRIPCGVDLSLFTPADDATCRRLRRQYGFDQSSRIALHAGHAKPGRNLGLMAAACQQVGWQAVAVISSFDRADPKVVADLKTAGVRVMEAVPRIVELYQLADAYVFPVTDERSCAELPLSVLEALACGLPTVATRFGGLPDLLPQCDRLTYADTLDEFAVALQACDGLLPQRPSELESLSWESVAAQVLAVIDEVPPQAR